MKVLIATPKKGGISEEFDKFKSSIIHLSHLGGFPGVEFHFEFCSGCSVNMARNILAHIARSNGFDKLLFVDMDVMPLPKHVERIICHDVPVVGGLYMKRNGHLSWLGRHAQGVAADPETHLVEYEDLPTGFLCIDVKKCLDVLAEKMPEIAFDAVDDPDADNLQYSTMHEFFPMGVTGPSSWREKFIDIQNVCRDWPTQAADPERTTLDLALSFMGQIGSIVNRNEGPRIFRGEDYHFSWLCRKAGLKIYADWQCFIHHKGECVFPLDPQFILNMAEKIKAKQGEGK